MSLEVPSLAEERVEEGLESFDFSSLEFSSFVLALSGGGPKGSLQPYILLRIDQRQTQILNRESNIPNDRLTEISIILLKKGYLLSKKFQDEYGVTVELAGISAGVLNAAGLAMGKSYKEVCGFHEKYSFDYFFTKGLYTKKEYVDYISHITFELISETLKSIFYIDPISPLLFVEISKELVYENIEKLSIKTINAITSCLNITSVAKELGPIESTKEIIKMINLTTKRIECATVGKELGPVEIMKKPILMVLNGINKGLDTTLAIKNWSPLNAMKRIQTSAINNVTHKKRKLAIANPLSFKEDFENIFGEDLTFAELKFPLTLYVTDIDNPSVLIPISSKTKANKDIKILPILLASIAIPSVFNPVKISFFDENGKYRTIFARDAGTACSDPVKHQTSKSRLPTKPLSIRVTPYEKFEMDPVLEEVIFSLASKLYSLDKSSGMNAVKQFIVNNYMICEFLCLGTNLFSSSMFPCTASKQEFFRKLRFYIGASVFPYKIGKSRIRDNSNGSTTFDVSRYAEKLNEYETIEELIEALFSEKIEEYNHSDIVEDSIV